MGKKRVLIVEDSEAEVMLTLEAFKEVGADIDISILSDGMEVMPYLRKEGKYQPEKRPHLIILDLNLPKMNGKEVLHKIKTSEQFRQIPVIILTTSKSQDDIFESYDQYANCYIQKPMDLDDFFVLIKRIIDFWVGSVLFYQVP
jgi:chemotaxis family two-component system response regulator Rcp1